jgi:hypothetical protein
MAALAEQAPPTDVPIPPSLAPMEDESVPTPTTPFSPLNGTPTPEPPPSAGSSVEPEVQEDLTAKAEGIKEKGNNAFKAKRYGEAIDSYTEAIGTCNILVFTFNFCARPFPLPTTSI